MATSVQQDKNFRDTLIPSNILEDAIQWIQDNMEPEDVFTKDQLNDWATENNYKQDYP